MQITICIKNHRQLNYSCKNEQIRYDTQDSRVLYRIR